MSVQIQDTDRCYRAVMSRDRRFDGVFYTAVTTTGIYCRPSCPAVTPRRHNVRFFATSAAAHEAGFRACHRCLPDATPGSPLWDIRADVAGRAMRLISDGLVEREGVPGLATRLGYSTRHLQRLLRSELGAGPLALARARRAQTARILIETTTASMADIAYAAGFSSIRQFNDTIRAVYDASPRDLRVGSSRHGDAHGGPGQLEIRLAVREPFDGASLLDFLRLRAVRGIEAVSQTCYRRSLLLAHGPAVVALHPEAGFIRCDLRLADLRDLGSAVERCRRLLDLDADPDAIAAVLGADPDLGPLVLARPGLRVPGHVDGFEVAVRAIIGQQISLAGARTLAARIVEDFGTKLSVDDDELTHVFPSPGSLAAAGHERFAMPKTRARSLVALAGSVADGTVVLDRGADRAEMTSALLNLPGVGPWTAGYIAMRALGDPDVFMAGDLGIRHAMRRLGLPSDPGGASRHAQRWRPWRSYAQMHLWTDGMTKR